MITVITEQFLFIYEFKKKEIDSISFLTG